MKGDKRIMRYIKPEFDVTIYEVEDILTESNGDDLFTDDDPDKGNSGDVWDD